MTDTAPLTPAVNDAPAEPPAARRPPDLAGGRRRLWIGYLLEALLLVVGLLLYAQVPLLNLNPMVLQQTSEHNEAATLHIVTEQALKAGVFPLWNPYMSSGFPVAGDFVSTFWNPVTTIPIAIWGGVNGYKISAFLSLLVAGLGQLALGRVLGLRWTLRLWSAAMLMFSGALGFYWRLGWHQLLVGVAWFPFAFAALIWALRSRRMAPLGVAAIPIFFVFSSAGGYYFLYLGVALVAITLMMLVMAPRGTRRVLLMRAIVIAVLAGGLSAVILVPGADVYRYTARETVGDPHQQDSQPIVYALLNYLIYDAKWMDTNILGQASGFTWLYVGALPFIGLLGLPLAFNRTRRRREAMLISFGLLALFLMWHANRHTIVKHVYETFKFLYQFRFTGRLLVVATIPLLILGALGLQGFWEATMRHWNRRHLTFQVSAGTATRSVRLSLPLLLSLVMIGLLLLSIQNVMKVNQPISFTTNQMRDARPTEAIQYMQGYDPGLYYMQAGDWRIWWNWTTAAYEFKQPMLNFAYNRRTRSFIEQQQGGVVVAKPRYIFPWNDSIPTDLKQIGTTGGQPLFEDPKALPYAFTVQPSLLAGPTPLVRDTVQDATVRWINPNQLGVRVQTGRAGDQLVALVSNFPGWTVYVDGQPAEMKLVNQYLGTTVLEGDHIYLFSYEPPKFYIGLAITALTALVVLWLLVADRVGAWRRSRRRTVVAAA